MSNLIKILIAVFALLVLVIGFNRADRTKSIQISGSTTLAPFMSSVASEYQKNRRLKVEITDPGSINGVNSLISGECDLAMFSTKILPEQLNTAEKLGVSLKSYLIGYDIIVPIVHPDNPVSSFSMNQLKEVFSGKIRNWSDLGEKDAGIQIIHRNNSSGTYHTFNQIVVPLEKGLGTVLGSNSSVLAYVSKHVNAIGYISKSYLNPEVKALTVVPSIKRPLYLFVNESKLNSTLRSFIIFILMDKKSKILLNANGFYPVKTEQN